MKIQVTIYALLIFMLIVTASQGEQMKNNNQAQMQVDVIVEKMANDEIGRIEVLHIPVSVLTRTAITPEMIEKQFNYKLTIVHGWHNKDELVKSLKSIEVQPTVMAADLRWGVIFYSFKDDSRVGAIYFDKSGSRGAISEIPVTFSGNFFKWLNSKFSHCFDS